MCEPAVLLNSVPCIPANMWKPLLIVVFANAVAAKLDVEDLQDPVDSSDDDNDDSSERIGATVTQVYQHPYASALLFNDSYICSAIVLNKYWLLTLSKCFEAQPEILSSYVAHKNLGNFTIRTGSSYNNKGGAIYKIKMIINNYDLHVSAAKVQTPLEFSSQLQSVSLPTTESQDMLGYLASIIAWTPNGHMRLVNAPVIDPAICERNTQMLPGHYVCLGGVQDPNRHFCRRDNGGAVIQNNTLIAISSFINTCALYSKTHAFPKVSSFSHWLDSIIWDEDNRPTSTEPSTTTTAMPTSKLQPNTTHGANNPPYYADPSKFMLTLPFDPINVPLEPAEDNSVLPRMSLYESYLQSMAKPRYKVSPESTKTTTKQAPTSIKMEAEPMPMAMHMLRAMPKRYDFNYNL